NSVVFGRDLRPQPAPTGLALLALAGVGGRSAIVERAIRYLHQELPETRAAQSLCWGVLGLRAWGCCPEAAASWLAQGFDQALRQVDANSTSSRRWAYLLLAAGERSLELLGLPPDRGNRHEA